MSNRHFPNWLKAYEEYAKDDYCPESFHKWVGLSVLAGALERKVWLMNGKITFFPNVFVLLVTYAGVGKSTALTRGTDFLERLKNEFNQNFNIIAEQSTEPAMIEAMKLRQEFMLTPTKGAFHSSGFFHASEASASALQNTHGNFTSTITAFYDAPKVFRKIVKSDPEPTQIDNVCFNMLAGATFDYLRTLVNETSVMGGFASRNIYVVNKERIVREPKWGSVTETDGRMAQLLYEDLCAIHRLVGMMRPTAEFIRAWEEFQPQSDRDLIAMNSPRLESLAARRSVNTTKIAMLLAVAESDDLVIDKRHWDEAQALTEGVFKEYPFILSQGAIADKTSQSGVTQIIAQTLKKYGAMTYPTLRRIVLVNGNNVEAVMKTLDYMIDCNYIKRETRDGSDYLSLLVDPDTHL